MPDLIPRPKSVTLDGSGNGTVQFSIDNHNQRWVVNYVHVLTSQAVSATPVPVCQFYKNGTGATQSVGGTYSGNLDTATGRVILFADDVLYAVWSGGIPGSVATAIISGTWDPDGAPLEG